MTPSSSIPVAKKAIIEPITVTIIPITTEITKASRTRDLHHDGADRFMTIELIDDIMTINEEGRLKNGRKERKRESKVGRNFAAIAGTYLILLFLIPITLPTDTIPDLSGRANRLDYATIDGTWSWGNNDNSDYEHAGHNQSCKRRLICMDRSKSNCSNRVRHR